MTIVQVVTLCAHAMIPVRSRPAGEGHARIVLPRDVLLDVKHVRRGSGSLLGSGSLQQSALQAPTSLM